MKKRILSLLLAVVMIMAMVPVHAHAADECPRGGNHDWSYSNWGSSCYRQCTKCYTGGSVDHEVTSWTVTGNTNKQHSGKCKNCNGNVSGYCSYTYNVYSSDANGHWQVCTVCNGASKASNHGSFTTKSLNNGTHAQTCGTCGYTKDAVACDYEYNSWYSDSNASGHTLVCSVCDHESASQAHTMGYKHYSGSQHYYCCTVCSYGQSYTNLKSCTYTYKNNGTTHTATCKDCNNVLSNQSHNYTNGFCVCGAEKHDHAWKLTANGNKITLTCTAGGTCDVATKGELVISAPANLTYNGEKKTAVVGITKNSYMAGNGSYSISYTTKSGSYVNEVRDAGDYKATVTYSLGSFGPSASATVEFTVKKANVNITATGFTGDYDGQKHGITVNAPAGLSVSYGESANSLYYSTSPVYEDAGTYTVYYKVADNKNYNISGATGSAVVKINKVTKNVTAKGYNDVYDGEAHGITVNAPEGLKVTYAEKEDGYYSSSAPTYKDAGTYTVYYKVEGNKNYDIVGGTGSATVQINPVEVSVTANGFEGTYDGENHGITVTAPEGLKVTYAEKEDGYYSSYAPTYKDAGTYTVYYKVEGNKNYDIVGGTGSATVKINPIEVDVTATGYEGPYDGQKHGITVNAPEGLTVTYSETGNDYSYSSYAPTYENAGEYTVYYKVTGTKNHKINGATGSATVKINPANLADLVSAEDYNGTYDGSARSITVNVPDDVTVTYSTDGERWYTWAPTFTEVGTYTVHYKAVANSGNYITNGARAATAPTVTGSRTVKIEPMDLATVVTASNTEFTFNRNSYTNDGTYANHSIILNVDSSKVYDSYNLVKEFSTDGGATWSTQNPAFVNAGVYTVNYRVYVRDYSASDDKDPNYIGVEGSRTVTINKAELPVTGLVGYHGPYDGSTHYGFGYKYSTSYGDYFTLYWYDYLHEELNYSFSWKDENGAAKSLVINAGDEPSLRDFPGFTKQNVDVVDSSKDTTDPRVHKVTVTIGSDNYNDKTFTYYVQIGPGGATAQDTTYTYDGDEHYIANYIFGHWYYGYGEIYNRGSVKIQYKEAGTSEWKDAFNEPGQTEVGYKDVDWMVTMDSDGNGAFGEEENSFGSPEVFTGTNRVTVTAVPLIAKANDKTITYGDAPANNGITITGTYVSPDTEAVVNKTGLTYTYSYAQYGNIGTYSITPAGLTATNYSIAHEAGTLTVVAKPVTILADESQESGFAVEAADLVNNDTCTITAVAIKDANGNDVTNPTAPGTYTATVTLSNSNYVPENTVTFEIPEEEEPDETAPTGNINVTTYNWNSLQSSITFDIYFKEAKNVTITASDETDGSGVKSIEYLVSNAAMTQAQLAALADSAWADYSAAFALAPNQKVIVYAKITDNAGNVAYISSNGMVFDNIAPDVDGIADRKQYTNGAEFTVSDNYELHSVTVDGKVVKPNSKGEYIIKKDNKYHTVIATDKAGNQTRLLIVTGEIPEVETPETGDTFNLVMWCSLMLASTAALVYVLVSKRKGTKK